MPDSTPTRILYTGTRPPPPVAGAEITHLPILRTTLFDLRATALPDLLATRDVTLVLYSRNAVRALVRADMVSAHDLPVCWCVGAKTAALLRKHAPDAQIHIPPEDAQTFEGLAEALIHTPHRTATIVALSVQGVQRPLAQRFEEARSEERVEVHTITAYKTAPREDLDALLPTLGGAAPFDWIVVTSPRITGAMWAALERSPEDVSRRFHTARWAAIGPTTAAALADLEIRCGFVPEVPDVGELLRAVAASGEGTA